MKKNKPEPEPVVLGLTRKEVFLLDRMFGNFSHDLCVETLEMKSRDIRGVFEISQRVNQKVEELAREDDKKKPG